jgi:ribosome-associated translation inhibitor RaiA
MFESVENPSAAVSVEFVGATSAEEREYVLGRIDSLTPYAPIRTAKVVILRGADRFGPRGVETRVNVRGDLLFVHASACGASTNEALDLARQRLYQLLAQQRHRPRHAGPHGSASSGWQQEN